MRARPLDVAGLHRLLGAELGPTAWYDVTQERVDAFATATEDHQWIHVDVERARRGPHGGTIAHGLYTLSLIPRCTEELLSFDGFAAAINYGYGRVRFPAPVPVGSRLRMHSSVTSIDDAAQGAKVTLTQRFERDGGERPVCVAEQLIIFVDTATAPGTGHW
jgi:acyl dehydratase